MDERPEPETRRRAISRRAAVASGALGISTLVLPAATAAASQDPVPAPAGDTIGFRTQSSATNPSTRVETFWYPVSGSFTFDVAFTVTTAASGSLNVTDGQGFTLGPLSTSVGTQSTMPDSIAIANGSVVSAVFTSRTSPPQTFTRTGHVWGTDTI
jgi:hypothetical protein